MAGKGYGPHCEECEKSTSLYVSVKGGRVGFMYVCVCVCVISSARLAPMTPIPERGKIHGKWKNKL